MKKWRILIIAIVLLPLVIFFPGCKCNCSCGKDSSGGGNNGGDNSDQIYTVSFYVGIDSPYAPHDIVQQVPDGGLVTDPNLGKSYPGHRLVGWYTTMTFDDGTVWTFTIDTVHSNMVLYARWEEI